MEKSLADVSVFYFVRRGGELSKRRATLEAIRDRCTAVMASRRVVDHTEVDGNGFLIGSAGEDPHSPDEIWSRIRSFESRANSRAAEALGIGDPESGRKALLLLESFALRK